MGSIVEVDTASTPLHTESAAQGGGVCKATSFEATGDDDIEAGVVIVDQSTKPTDPRGTVGVLAAEAVAVEPRL